MTGFNNLAYHSHNKDNSIPGECRLCNGGREEFLHLALECPELRIEREQAFGRQDANKGWNIPALNTFLENPKVLHLMENRKEDDPE